ncbi:tRNA pseudouridine(13) synthase TruD, partial [Azotobacter chroococcum]|nr:tRNA pseudouridine(13) synthase TruD [Azotobacter chroococcum]
ILQLEFVLPAGCFATVVVRELVDLLPAGPMDTSCVF